MTSQQNNFTASIYTTNLLLMPSIFFKHVLLLSMPGESEWLLILLVILLFFGGKKIPDLMKGIGRGVREFNDAKEHLKEELDAGMKEKDVVPSVPSTDPSAVPPVSAPASESTL